MVGRIFSVGDLCVDVLQGLSAKIRFGEEQNLKTLDFSVGGNAANFAVIASKLGLNPVLISSIGEDFATAFLKKELSKAKVSSRLIQTSDKNSFSIIAVNDKGERAIQSKKNALDAVNAKNVSKLLLPKLKEKDVVLFGGFYHLLNFRKDFISLLRKLKNRKAIVCFDTCFDTTGRWNISEFLPFFDYLFVNTVELKHIAGGKTMEQRVQKLFRKGLKCVVVKQGYNGATLFRKGLPSKRFPSVAKKVVDTTGAGDSFNAGFVFGIVRNYSFWECMLAGNFVAGHKIRKHGLHSPGKRALEKFVVAHRNLEPIVKL